MMMGVGLIDIARMQDWAGVLFIGFTLGFFIGCLLGYRVGLYKGNGGT